MPEGSAAERCRICHGPVSRAFTAHDRNRRLSAERFEYVRCKECGTLALATTPKDLGAFYPPDYYRVPASRTELLAVGRRAEQAKVELLRPFSPGGRLIEVGPAVGAFLAVAQEEGYAVEAVEMDERCCTFLERELGVPTTCSDDPAAVLSARGRFDVVALWHVIEHVVDPVSVLAAAAQALAPGGVLALAAPNPDAFQFRVLGSRWTHIDAPRHLFLLPLQTLTRLGAEHGLEPVLETTNDYCGRGWNSFGWRESLANLVPGGRMAGLLRLAGSVIARLLAPVEQRGLRGATYTLLLRRPSAM
jgi:2-polyprenyl-3-methyl-5-hydroxy-6-metoxy-1,4-benzoquinol methylase